MDWILRYTKEVARYLPARDRGDVSEELSGLLEERVADEAENKGRDLTEGEVLELIRAHGHPLTVAVRYTGRFDLISPDLFPIYLLALRYLAVTVFTAYLAFIILRNLVAGPTLPGYELSSFLNVGFLWVGLITVGFHFAGRLIAQQGWLTNWSPQSLPPVDAEMESVTSSAFVVMVTTGWFVVLNLLPLDHTMAVLLGKEGNVYQTFVFWLKIQAAITVAVYLVLAFAPRWTVAKRVMIVSANVALIVGIGICLNLEVPLPPEHLNAAAWLPKMVKLTLSIWMLGLGISVFHHVRRVMQ